MKIRLGLTCGLAIGLSGCGLPSAGPTTGQVIGQARRATPSFDLVDVTYPVIAALAAAPAVTLPDGFADAAPASVMIDVGDSVAVQIWTGADAGDPTGPLAGSLAGGGDVGSGSQPVVVPAQVVGTDGAITVPYAGQVHVAGRSAAQVQADITRRLSGTFIKPQVLVTVPNPASSQVVVLGDVARPGEFALSVRGSRLLDVIAAAGGPRSSLYAGAVQVVRGASVARMPLAALAGAQALDVYLQPGDVVTVLDAARSYTVFGATLTNTQVPLSGEHVSLVQALAKSGGLIDERADPVGVFLLRFESPQDIAALGLPPLPGGQAMQPVVFHVDLQQLGGYFLASRLDVRDGDVIYAANASSDALRKFFALIGTVTSPAIAGAAATRN